MSQYLQRAFVSVSASVLLASSNCHFALPLTVVHYMHIVEYIHNVYILLAYSYGDTVDGIVVRFAPDKIK